MKLEMAQRLENRDKRQTRRDPAEIGSNVDVALLTCTFVDTPGASEDTVEADIGSWGEAYTYKENYLTIQIQIQIREPWMKKGQIFHDISCIITLHIVSP